MSVYRSTRRLLPFAVAACFYCLAGATAVRAQERAPTGELRLLRVLVVLDTSNSNLHDCLKVDEWRLRHTLTQTIPKGRYELRVLSGKEARAEEVLSYYRKLKTGPDEGLLFFYGGHGAIDPKKGPFFKMEKGPILFRKDVLVAMEAKKAGLVVLLSDCCSNKIPVKSLTTDRAAPPPATSLKPTAAALLFRARGTVDITAAESDKPAYGDAEKGGLFTRSFCKLLVKDTKDLDSRSDGLDWKRFFGVLRKEMRITFPLWRKDMLQRSPEDAASITDNTQEPHAYKLPAGGVVPASGESVRLVVSVKNGFDRTITYSYRWTGEPSWRKKTLTRGERYVHHAVVKRGATEAKLEIMVEGDKDKPHQLDGKRWSGSGSPTSADAARYVLSDDP